MNKGSHWTQEERDRIRKQKLDNPVRYWLGKKRDSNTILKMSIANKGKKLSEETKKKISSAMKGKIPSNFKEAQKRAWMTDKREEHSNQWKGDKVGYFGLHTWVQKRLGKANHCERIGCTNKSRKYCWGNISGEYRRDIDDWYQVCNSCNQLDGVCIPERIKRNNIICQV